MVLSNWRGAICRGTLVVLLAWAGLAWTQTPEQRPAGNGAERFVYVHENGQKTRCRVLESWQLPDGRMAHLLETVETKEKITIVDEPAPAGDPGSRGWARQKRIFSWGLGRTTPPDGAPLPPHLRLESGVVINNDTPAPAGAIPNAGPVILNQATNDKMRSTEFGPPTSGPNNAEPAKKQPVQVIDFQNPPAPSQSGWVPAGSQGNCAAGPLIVNQTPAGQNGGADSVNPKRTLFFPRINAFLAKPFDAQGCNNTQPLPPAIASASGGKLVIQGQDLAPTPTPAVMPAPSGIISTPIATAPAVLPAPAAVTPPSISAAPPAVMPPSGITITPIPIAPAPGSMGTPPCVAPGPICINTPPSGVPAAPVSMVPPTVGISPPPASALPTPIGVAPAPSGFAPPSADVPPRPTNQGIGNLAPNPVPAAETSAPSADPNKSAASNSGDSAAKKSWRPGEFLFGWMHKPAAPSTPTPTGTPTEPEFVRPAEPTPVFNTNDVLTNENKLAEKRINDRVAGMPKAPVSTAMAQGPSVPSSPPEAKKPEAAPLAISGSRPAPDEKVATLPAPPLAKDDSKPAVGPTVAERDMWGKGTNENVMPPGRSLLDPTAIKPDIVKLPPAPAPRMNDPLTAPERFNPSDDKLKPRGITTLPAAPKSGPEANVPQPPRMLPPANSGGPPTAMSPGAVPYAMGPPSGSPLGSQSVLAARSGLQGPVAFVPYPVVTVPQPNHPPMPPPPQMPDAPQLNAYVNAFTPPPAPKGPAPTASSVPPWMQPNPAMQQQAMMQQQMMQQQQMMAQGYRPNPMNPYFPYNQPAAPSQGPMTNYARTYQGPMPPNPYSVAPAMASGYAPAGYAPPLAPGYAPAGYAPPLAPGYAPAGYGPPPAPSYAAAGYGPPMMPGYAPGNSAPPMMAMMPQQPMVQPASFQQVPTQQAVVTQQVEQLIKVMRESPYPAQRQWASQSLTSFDWRVHPQIVPALLQSASQDPAAGVRADCVTCLGRIQASVEPVFGILHAMRNDIDPRVRQAVEQAFVSLGQAPIAPQQ